jgi:phage shock protein A
MTIDERIEALTMNLELLTKDVQDLQSVVRNQARQHGRLEDLVIQIAEGMARLVNATQAHEQRISNLESNL